MSEIINLHQPQLMEAEIKFEYHERGVIVIDRSACPEHRYPALTNSMVLRQVADMMDQQQGIIRGQ